MSKRNRRMWISFNGGADAIIHQSEPRVTCDEPSDEIGGCGKEGCNCSVQPGRLYWGSVGRGDFDICSDWADWVRDMIGASNFEREFQLEGVDPDDCCLEYNFATGELTVWLPPAE